MQPMRKVEKPMTQPTVLREEGSVAGRASRPSTSPTHSRFSVRSSPIAHIPLPT